MTTEPRQAGPNESGRDSTRYEVTLDRAACDGVFACLVRDDRFLEASDGLASIDGDATGGGDDPSEETGSETVRARFDDDRIDDARQAAAACPVDAISVEVITDE